MDVEPWRVIRCFLIRGVQGVYCWMVFFESFGLFQVLAQIFCSADLRIYLFIRRDVAYLTDQAERIFWLLLYMQASCCNRYSAIRRNKLCCVVPKLFTLLTCEIIFSAREVYGLTHLASLSSKRFRYVDIKKSLPTEKPLASSNKATLNG